MQIEPSSRGHRRARATALTVVALAGIAALAGCDRESSAQSAASLVQAGSPAACAHPDTLAALERLVGAQGEASEIVFSGFDEDRLRVSCTMEIADRRADFEVMENLARPGSVVVSVVGGMPTTEPAPEPAAAAPVPPAREPVTAQRLSPRGYVFDIPENYPQPFAIWRRETAGLELEGRREWVRTLSGTGTEVSQVSLAGSDFLRGWVCEPHNCGGNEALILISVDQSRVYGVVRLTDANAQITDQFVGRPNAAQQRCLVAWLEDRSGLSRCA